MAVENVRIYATAAEAVAFAVSDHGRDTQNYNLERQQGLPYARDEVESLLRHAGYRMYQRFTFNFSFERPPGHAIGWIRPSRPHPRAIELLKDFASRPVSSFDPRLEAFHRMHNAPVATLLRSKLLTFELREEELCIYSTMFSGPSLDGTNKTQEEVINILLQYGSEYLAPLRLETTAQGEFRVDQAHLADPENPHNFEHLHVYHRTRPYHTTLRLAR
jgi:hypothetical protein